MMYEDQMDAMFPEELFFMDNLKKGLIPMVKPDWISDRKWSFYLFYWWCGKLDNIGAVMDAAHKETHETVEQWAYLFPENPFMWCECQFVLLDRYDMI